MKDALQFYPTPPDLARKAWSKFNNQNPRRLLEPSAGRGDLLRPMDGRMRSSCYKNSVVDCVEIDMNHHAELTRLGYRLIGDDFMDIPSGSIYSHIIMNPPFGLGADHLLHAWDILWDGEIVAILNAETLKNPFSAKRQHLLRLIEQHGDVEYVQSAFLTDDTQRETAVEVALVHLVKRSEAPSAILREAAERMRAAREDSDPESELGSWQREHGHRFSDVESEISGQAMALPGSIIATLVIAYRMACDTAIEAEVAAARHGYYARLVGKTLEEYRAAQTGDAEKENFGFPGKSESSSGAPDADSLRDAIAARIDALREAAWLSVIHSTEFMSRTTEKMRKELESALDQFKAMEFSEVNVRKMLGLLVDNAGVIQVEMICEMFDEITRYHSDNTAYYKGWKSNDRHRIGMKIRSTRFILPTYNGWEWLSSTFERKLDDIDRVMDLLDGQGTDLDREDTMRKVLGAWKNANVTYGKKVASPRLSSRYFDVRNYPKASTIHFFPRRPDLIERMNRIVGQHRQWLPETDSQASEAFWKHYRATDKWEKKLTEKVDEIAGRTPGSAPFYSFSNCKSRFEELACLAARGLTDENRAKEGAYAERILEEAILGTAADEGIDVKSLLEGPAGTASAELDGSRFQSGFDRRKSLAIGHDAVPDLDRDQEAA